MKKKPSKASARRPSLAKFKGRGRPSKTLSDLPSAWQAQILDEMSSGASKDEIKALLGISNDVHAKWMRAPEEGQPDIFSEYREHIRIGEQLSHAWWQRVGRKSLLTPGFNHGLWYMNMKNRFGWKDRTEVEDPGRDAVLKQAINLGNGVKVVF